METLSPHRLPKKSYQNRYIRFHNNFLIKHTKKKPQFVIILLTVDTLLLLENIRVIFQVQKKKNKKKKGKKRSYKLFKMKFT